MGRLFEMVFEHAGKSGKRAIFAHSVTNHAFTQKICRAHGFADTALLVGYAGSELSFRRIHDTLSQRESTVISFRWLVPPETSPRLFLPPNHAELIAGLYAATGVTVSAAETARASGPEESVVTDTVVAALDIAEVIVKVAGTDLPRQLARVTRRLCIAKVDVLYLILDLEDPGTPDAAGAAESLGYFFAGIFPGYRYPHALILQYVNNIAFDYDAIVTLSPEAARIREYQRRYDPNQGV
jgi:serine/threonine-protein kinase RsbW